MPELTPTDPWVGTTDPTTGEPWRSSLAEALRANGFEASPPPIDDEPDAWPVVTAVAADPRDDLDAPPALDADPGSAWWLDASALPQSDHAAAMAIAPPAPLAAPTPTPAPGPVLAAVPFHAPAAPAPTPAPVVPPAVPDAAPRPLNAPTSQAAAAPPSPPAFLAGRIARSAAPALPPDAAEVEDVGQVPADAATEAWSPAEAWAPAPTEPEAWPLAAAEPEGAASAGVEPPPDGAVEPAPLEDGMPAAFDPRASLAWPEPKPLNDEGWPTAPVLPVAAAPVWATDATQGAADGPTRGFAWDEPEPAPTPPQDPWADVRFSASDAVADETGVDALAPDPDLPAAAVVMAAAATPDAPEAPAGPDAPTDDLAELRAQATAWLVADAADDATADAAWHASDEPDAVEEPVAAASPWGTPAPLEPAPATPDWIVPAAEAPTPEAFPAAPDTSAATAVHTGTSPVGLDPERVEFVGYVEAAPARPIVPPSGSILDVGRRPPGAKPVDPATLASRSATAGPAIASEPVVDTPGATGGDLWDLVTAPTPAAVPEQAAGRGSRAVTILLSLLVALVIVALVLGFLYSFTGLL